MLAYRGRRCGVNFSWRCTAATSERGRLCSISLVRSSRRQPSTTACPGGDELPQGGGAAPNCCVAERRSEHLGVCQLWKENHRGVKFIRAQDYAGVDKW